MKRRILPSFSISKVRTKALMVVGALVVMLTIGVSGFLIAQRISVANAAGEEEEVIRVHVSASPEEGGTVSYGFEPCDSGTPRSDEPGESDIDGDTCKKIRLHAEANVNEGWYIIGWFRSDADGNDGQNLSDTGDVVEHRVTTPGDYYYRAKFARIITVYASPNNGGNPTATIAASDDEDNCANSIHTYVVGTYGPDRNSAICYSVTLTSNPNDEYNFASWRRSEDGDNVSPRDSHSFYTWGDGEESGEWWAIYEKIPKTYTIIARTRNPGRGQVQVGDGEEKDEVIVGDAEEGQEILIQAISKEGYEFDRWSDGDTNAERTIMVDGDAIYTAIFKKDDAEEDTTYIIMVESDSAEMGQISIDWSNPANTMEEEAYANDRFMIAAIPKEGYEFDRWSDGDTNAWHTVEVTEDVTYTAHFVKISDDNHDGDSDGDGDLPTPDASADATGTNTPDTGANTRVDGDGASITNILVPILVASSLAAGVIIKRRGSHVKFD